MSGSALDASALGWAGLVAGLAGLGAYVLIVLRQPQVVRMLNGSGLMLTSLALTQSQPMIAAARGEAAFAAQSSVALLILAVLAQAAAGLRNRRAWDGVERRSGVGVWDGMDRRGRRALGEERA